MTRIQKLLLAVFLLAAGASAGVALATSAGDITFPVQELGNCKNQKECRTYCDKQDNMAPCVAFAKKHNLMSEQDIKKAEALLSSLDTGGPGGCTTKESCETFCDDANNIEVCVAFAEKHGLMSAQELKESKQVVKALKKGAKLPGSCANKEACETYCQDPNNVEECVSFAEAAGFMKPEEAQEARKMMGFMQRGETPGNCKSKESCDSYCSNDKNIMECVGFAEKAGMISKEEADMARKTGGKGPGGCRSKESCDAFCNTPQNQQACFEFAKEHGLLSEEDLERIQEGMESIREALEEAPEEVVECLKENLGENIIQEIEEGTFTPGPAIGEKVRTCFELMRPDPAELEAQIMESIPDEMQECVQPKVHAILQRITEEEEPDHDAIEGEVRGVVEACGEEMREQMMPDREDMDFPEGMSSPEGMGPEEREQFESEVQRRTGEETQRKTEEIRRAIEEQIQQAR